jgi:hypothetical protein
VRVATECACRNCWPARLDCTCPTARWRGGSEKHGCVIHRSAQGSTTKPLARRCSTTPRRIGWYCPARPSLRNADRKGRIERPFSYVECNFLAGRTFVDYDDLNRQALAWCREVANQKVKRVLGMSPEAAYLIEKPYLTSLPPVLPPVYEVLERVVDLYGYVSVDTNRYSVPERLVGQAVSAHKHPAEIVIYHRGSKICHHPRLFGPGAFEATQLYFLRPPAHFRCVAEVACSCTQNRHRVGP